MMKKRILVGLLVLVLMLVQGCGLLDSSPKVEHNYRVGVEEVEFDLLEGSPPDEVYQDSTFKLILGLKNEMGYSARNIKISINGFDRKYFELDEVKKDVNIMEGKEVTNPKGDQNYLEFSGKSKLLFLNEKEKKNIFSINAEYETSLTYAESVCLNPFTYSVQEQGCKVDTSKSYSGQGGPLAIAKLEQVMIPGDGAEVEFRLKLKNKGDGKVKTVTMKDTKLGGKDISCQFQKLQENKKQVKFTAKDQEVVVVCRGSVSSGSSYFTTLKIDFVYDYEFTKTEDLTLIR